MNNKGSTIILVTLVAIVATTIVAAALDLSRYLLAVNGVERASVDASRCLSAVDGICSSSKTQPFGLSTKWAGINPGDVSYSVNQMKYSVTELTADVSYQYYTALMGSPAALRTVYRVPLKSFTTDAGFMTINRATSLSWAAMVATPKFTFPIWNEGFERIRENSSIDSYMNDFSLTYGVPRSLMGRLSFAKERVAPGDVLSLASSVQIPYLPPDIECSSSMNCGVAEIGGELSDFRQFATIAIKTFGFFKPDSRNVDLQWGGFYPGLQVEIFDVNGVSQGVKVLGGRVARRIPASGGNMNLWIRGPLGSHGGNPSERFDQIKVPRGGSFTVNVNLTNHDSVDSVTADIDVFYFYDDYFVTEDERNVNCGENLLNVADNPNPDHITCPDSCYEASSAPITANCVLSRQDIISAACLDDGFTTYVRTPSFGVSVDAYTCEPALKLPIPAGSECDIWREYRSSGVLTVETDASPLSCEPIVEIDDCLAGREIIWSKGKFLPSVEKECKEFLDKTNSESINAVRHINRVNQQAGLSSHLLEKASLNVEWDISPTRMKYFWNDPGLGSEIREGETREAVLLDGSGCLMPLTDKSYEDLLKNGDCPLGYSIKTLNRREVELGILPQFQFDFVEGDNPVCSNTPKLSERCNFVDIAQLVKSEFSGEYVQFNDPNFMPTVTSSFHSVTSFSEDDFIKLLRTFSSEKTSSCVAASSKCEHGLLVDLGWHKDEEYPEGPESCWDGTFQQCYRTKILRSDFFEENQSERLKASVIFEETIESFLPGAERGCDDPGCYDFSIEEEQDGDIVLEANYRSSVGPFLETLLGQAYIDISYRQREQNELRASK